MNKKTGSLSIHSENIFPIIKKWLYSDYDIFIRELISNGCDAITKVRKLETLGEADLQGESDFRIEVILNQTAKTLTFTDNGIGMTGEEVEKYINQIAFSGAEDFLNTYKDKSGEEQIIGHFGLGFYSAFMVADRVEINTLSYRQDAASVKWLCDGGTEFEMEEGSRSKRGTEIILYLGEEGKDFLNEHTIRSTINKYCSFMPYPIYFKVEDKEPEKDDEGNIIIEEVTSLNDLEPLYLKQPTSCTDEEYKEFYQKTFHDFKEPLFWIHLNMDYPFNLKGILYFPKLSTNFDTMEGQIKLYNNRVFVADNIKEVIPEFLLLLKGVIDCPDLPLNVSRSFLQNDGFVKKISDYISKKVASKLNDLFKTDRSSYEKFWDDINPFIKYGSLRDEKFAKRVEPVILYKTTGAEYLTLGEYLDKVKEKHENNIYYITDQVQQAQYIKMLKDHGLEAVILDHSIDPPFISQQETSKQELHFKRVDSDIAELLAEDDLTAEDKQEEQERLLNLFKAALNKDDLKIELETLKTDTISGMIVLSETNRRMQEMAKLYSISGLETGMFPNEETLILNKKHPLIKYLLQDTTKDSETSHLLAKQIYDIAMLSHKPLSPEAMTEFIKRSNDIMNIIIS